jgi:hypothetical protein
MAHLYVFKQWEFHLYSAIDMILMCELDTSKSEIKLGGYHTGWFSGQYWHQSLPLYMSKHDIIFSSRSWCFESYRLKEMKLKNANDLLCNNEF